MEHCNSKLYASGDLKDYKRVKQFEKEYMGTFEPIKKEYMGTVEPRYTDDSKHPILGDGQIHDDALGFIYGAIKKYGSDPIYYNDLKKYISMMVERIGERNV